MWENRGDSMKKRILILTSYVTGHGHKIIIMDIFIEMECQETEGTGLCEKRQKDHMYVLMEINNWVDLI